MTVQNQIDFAPANSSLRPTTKIFLSYNRKDVDRVRPVAVFLNNAGHDVWWDREITGGHEFGPEIEAELLKADKIVVLWSERSVKSAWVRDEAGVGRDSGRLIPVTLDGSQPPLGFRQFQTIDLSKWKGRGSCSELLELLKAVGDIGAAIEAIAPSSVAHERGWTNPRVLSAALVILLVVTLTSALLLWSSSGPETPAFAAAPGTATGYSQAVRVSASNDVKLIKLRRAARERSANALDR